MASFKVRAKILEIGETKTIGKNGFKKREVVAMIEGEYPDYYNLEFIKDNVNLPDDLIVGTYATFQFNLNGKKVEKEGKDPMYFISMQCWKIDIG